MVEGFLAFAEHEEAALFEAEVVGFGEAGEEAGAFEVEFGEEALAALGVGVGGVFARRGRATGGGQGRGGGGGRRGFRG